MNYRYLFYKIYLQAKPYFFWFFISFVLAIIISLLTPIRPYLIQVIIDQDIRNYNQPSLVTHVLYIFILLISESLLRFVFIYATSFFSQNIVHDLRLRVFSHLTNLHVQFFDTTPVGRLTTRTINDVETINEVYSENFFTIISDILTVIFVLIAMFYTNVKLTLISLVTLPFLYIATYVFKEQTQKANQHIRDKIGELNAFAQEHFMGFKVVKSFVVENKEFKRFDKLNADYTALNVQIIQYYSWFFPVLETLISISTGLVITYVAFYGFQMDGVSVGMISSFLLYINLLFRPMRFFADKFNSLQMGFVASERVFKLLDTPSLDVDTGSLSPANIEGSVAFDHVTFGYTPGQVILNDVSFHIPARKSMAIVGATGSGKTSIINVLNRFYPIQSGSITIDNININDFKLSSLRQSISMVLQEVYLFSGTILDNIIIDNPHITKEDVVEMAKELGIHEFFMQLPNNYNFEIKERGNSLSHGQRQIISLFRAIAKNPAVLILDEATSSIDSNTEFYIQKLISKIIKDKTSIVIAHRLSTIVEADRILVLDKGVIVGEGTHRDLLASNPFYQKYFVEYYPDDV